MFTTEESTELLQYIATNMVTKADLDESEKRVKSELRRELRKDINAGLQRVMDYTDKRVTQAEGKIIRLVRKEDEKVDKHVRATENSGAISHEESHRLLELGPFPKLKIA